MEHIPSHAIPMDAKDSIIVESFNSLASPSVDVFVRFLDSEGRTHRGGFRHTPNTDRTSATSRFRIGKGHLVSVAFEPVGFTPRRGQTFIRAFITRDDVGVVQPDFPIISDYLVEGALLAWPGSPLRSSIEGPGHLRVVAGNNPAAGVEISLGVLSGVRWLIKGFRFLLVTDATAINRSVRLIVDDGATGIWSGGVSSVQGASLSVTYSCVSIGAEPSNLGDTFIHLPELLAVPGSSRVRTVTENLQAGDDFGAPQIYVEEWLEP